MANYQGHVAGAAIFCGAYLAVLAIFFAMPLLVYGHSMLPEGWQRIVALFVIAILFGLWPDVDTNSKGQDIFYGAIFGLDILLVLNHQLEAAAYLGLLAMLPIIGHHRGWTHSYWAMIIVPLPILIVPYLYNPDHWQPAMIYYGAAVVGYFSHLALDGLVVRWFRVKT